MASEQLKKKIEEYKEVCINNAQMVTGGGTKTDLFKCRKCKSNDCSYFQLQTRSADEPMTTYVWCYGCGNRWKVSQPMRLQGYAYFCNLLLPWANKPYLCSKKL